MTIIAFEEHYGLLAIHEAAKKASDPYEQVLEAMRKSGQFADDSKTGFPAGIYDLGEGRGGSLLWTKPASMWRSSRTLRRGQSVLSHP
jgi:hypothetical protein